MPFHGETAQLINALFGKELGGQAPAPQPGQSLGVGGGLFDTLQAIQQFAPQQQDLAGLIGPLGPQGEELPPQTRPEDFVGPPILGQGSPDEVGPPIERQGQQQGPFGSFFGNLDQNLQSPSKVLGLGLLNQLDPRLAGLGLFAGGLFGQNKLF